MLDENLPTFLYRPSDNPLSTVLYFTHNGSEPQPEHLLQRPEPSKSKNQYAIALSDANYSSVIYGEVLVTPEVSTLTSAVEIRAQAANTAAGRTGSPSGQGQPASLTPDTFVLRLYNPDQNVGVKQLPGSWNRTECWEFEMPQKSFKAPSTSRIDQDDEAGGDNAVDFAPKIVFRWKRDGRISRDMTCYMTGKSVAGKKSKEPDITVALYKSGKHESLTIYEPNLQRVDLEDRKGLEIVVLLSAGVIRDLYLSPKADPFNTTATASQPAPSSTGPQTSTKWNPPSHGAAAVGATTKPSTAAAAVPKPHASSKPKPQGSVDAETKRLQESLAAEEERAKRDREKRDKAEQRRIRKMLEEEEKERRRRDAEVEKETERLRKLYGTQGQTISPVGSPDHSAPALPPRPPNGGLGGWFARPGGSSVPQRPSSAGPGGRPVPASSQHQQIQQQPQQSPPHWWRPAQPSGANAGEGSSSGHGRWWSRDLSADDGRNKVQKKKSVNF